MVDVLIIGAGCAGLTAAIYATRAGHRVVVLEKLFHGGQISVTNEVENYPAIDRISGPDLANRIYEQAAALGADVRYEDVSEVDLAGPVKRVTTSGGEYEARAVIIANGVQRRKLQCPGEEKFLGRGVSYCATCDGAFFQGKDTAVVGGGNTALEDALFLANLCRTVYLVHRRDSFRGEKVLAEAVAQRPNIRPLFNKTVESIHGGQSVEGAALLDTVTGERTQLPISAVFVAIGMQPDNGLFAAAGLDENGYIQADESCTTRLPGVFVAGDTRTKWLRQIITAAADGAVAATRAGHYLETAGLGQSEEALSPV